VLAIAALDKSLSVYHIWPPMTFLFPKIQEILKGRHFDDTDDIRSNTTAALKAIPQNQFQNGFEGWTRRWHWYIGDHGGFQQ
jgi:hypothetical protein